MRNQLAYPIRHIPYIKDHIPASTVYKSVPLSEKAMSSHFPFTLTPHNSLCVAPQKTLTAPFPHSTATFPLSPLMTILPMPSEFTFSSLALP